MPEKKKPTAKETPAWVAKALELTVRELAEKKEQLDARNTELFETQAKLDKAWRVNDAEVAFWKKEVEHLQQRLADAVVAAAVKK